MKKVLLLCLFALPVFSQSANITGIPDDVTVFTITLKSGDELHGAIQLKGVFINDYSEVEESSMTSVTVISDSPSNPGKRSENRINITFAQPETPQKREKRYNNEGFVIVTDTGGNKMLVRKITQTRVQRLAELQRALSEQEQERIAAYEEAPTTTKVEKTGAGFVALWGRHMLTFVVAGLLLFGIVKICF